MKILLHLCCGPCGTESVERLKKDYEVILFFPNSNIFPEEEFKKRLENAEKLAKINKVKIISEDYGHKRWLDFIKGFEKELEGGKRCEKCFEYNLIKTAEKAKELGISLFTTTLTISPHKSSKKIFEIGKIVAEKLDLTFLDMDFKKKDGFKHSAELSKSYGIYRQSYCGCEFSMRINMQSPKE